MILYVVGAFLTVVNTILQNKLNLQHIQHIHSHSQVVPVKAIVFYPFSMNALKVMVFRNQGMLQLLLQLPQLFLSP